MIDDNCQQRSCVECVIKKQEYENNLSKLEQRFMMYKEKLILTNELISKYSAKCKENENLQKQQKKYNALLKEYQSKLTSAVTKQMPLEEELEKLKKVKVALEEMLYTKTSHYAATEKHNVQLNNLVQQLKDDIIKLEMKLELEKDSSSNLTHSLKEAKAEKLSVEKKRLKTLQHVVSFGDIVQKEGRLKSTHKKMLARWRTELRCLLSGEGDISEDEGICSPALASSCASRDTGMGSITELLSDDDHSSVHSLRLESSTSNVKDHCSAVISDVTCKPLTSDHTKKLQLSNNSRLSSGTVVPHILGSKSEVMTGSNGIQSQESSEVAAMSETKSDKMNSSTNTYISPNKTYVEEAVTENGSEVDNVKSSDRSFMAGVTQKAGLTSGMRSLEPLSLFDPDIPLTLSGVDCNKEATTSEAMNNRNGTDLVHVTDNSGCTSTLTRVESPVDISLFIKNVMEEMSVPNPLSPLDPEPEIKRSHGQSNSSLANTEQVKLRDASTWTWVETLDAAVGVDEVAKWSHHVAIQTNGIMSCKTACQTNIINYNTCAVQTDDTDMLHTSDSISHIQDKLSNCSLPTERTTCHLDKEQDKVQVFRKTVTNVSAVKDSSFKSNGSSSKGLEELNFPDLTPEQKCVESKSKKICILVRCDYKAETCLKEDVKKWETLVPSLCSNKNDNSSVEEDVSCVSEDFSIPATAVQHCISKQLTQQSTLTGDKHLTQQSTQSAGKHLIQQATPTTDKCLAQQSAPSAAKCLPRNSTPTTKRPLTHQGTLTDQNIVAASGVFAVEDTPRLLGYPKEVHPHERIMPFVPNFQHHCMHMDPLLLQSNMLSCQSPVQSMADIWRGCCYKNNIHGACVEFNHSCVSQGLQNHCSCRPCVVANQSNCRAHNREAEVQMSSVRSASDQSPEQVQKRILNTEDSSYDMEAGDHHRMPYRKLCLKSDIVNSVVAIDTDTEAKNTVARRRKIYADKQGCSVGMGLGRKMAIKLSRKGRKVHINGGDSAFSVNEEREKLLGLRKINSSMKGDKRTKVSSDKKQEDRTFSKLKKRKKKYVKNDVKYMLQKAMDLKFPYSKDLISGQLSGHIKESDAPGVKAGNEVPTSQHETVECIQHFQVGSHSVEVSAVLQSDVQQKMAQDATEENVHKHSSHEEVFGTIPGVCTGMEQHGGRTWAQNVSDSLLYKRKRKASNPSASKAENRIIDCPFSEMQKSKRAKTSSASEGGGDLVNSNDSAAVSNVTLHSVSESVSEKYVTRNSRASTSIILPSVKQPCPNQEYKFSAADEKFKVSSMPEAAQAVGKPDAYRHAGPQLKLSKLEKLRRNLVKAKRPFKIATEMPETVKRRTSRILRSESSCAGSDFKKPRVRGLSETARKGRITDLITNVGNVFVRPQHQSTRTPFLEGEKPSAKHNTVAPNIANELVSHSNSVVDPCNSVTGQEPNTRREIRTETNCTDDVNSLVSTDVHAGIPNCFQDSIPLSSHVTETVGFVSEVHNASEVHTKSTLMGKVPKVIQLQALSLSCKEDAHEASDVLKTTGLVTLPDVCDTSESVMEVCSPGVVHKTSEIPRDLGDAKLPTAASKVFGMENEMPYCVSPIKDPDISLEIKSLMQTSDAVQISGLRSAKLPTTTSKVGGVENVMHPKFYQERVPCCVSPIKDPDRSLEVKSLIQTSDKMEISELQSAKLPTTTSKVGAVENVMHPKFYQERVPCCVSPIKDPDRSLEVKSLIQTSDAVQISELRSAKLPTTTSNVAGVEDLMVPKFYQEVMPCHFSPVRDRDVGELQISSEVKSLIQTSDKMQIAELPTTGLSTESSVRMMGSVTCQTDEKHITVMSSSVTKSTNRKQFAGCLLQLVLKDYKAENRKQYPKKHKSMTSELGVRRVTQARKMKQQEQVIFEKEIQQLLSSRFESRKFQQVVKKFSGFTSESAPLVLAKIIVKTVRNDTEDKLNYRRKHGAPPLTPTQEYLVALVFTLQSEHEQYKVLLETILLGIEYRLFRLGHAPSVKRTCSLARFYAALCLVHRDKLRLQAFCYDALYSLNYKAFPLLFTVYTTYPGALPNYDVGKDVLLVMTISCLILTQPLGRDQTEYKIKDLQSLLQTRYGYCQGVLSIGQLLQHLVDQLRTSDGPVEGLQASLILLAKRMGWSTTYRQLLCHNLIPLVDEWRVGAVSDRTIIEVIIIMGYITRCFPIGEAKVNVQAVLHLLGPILLEKNASIEVQEAAAASLLRLARHNFFYVSDLLMKWQPSGGSISDSLLREMLPFFGLRSPKWWHSFLESKEVHS